MANGAVTTTKLANGSVTANKLDPALIASDISLNQHRLNSTLDHPDGSVTIEKLAPSAIETLKNSGGMVKIADVLMSGVTTINNIPQTYRHLKAFVVARSLLAAMDAIFYIRLNSDTTNEYWLYSSTTPSNSFDLARIPAANADAGFYSTLELFIGDYTNTNIAKSVQIFQISKGQKAVAGTAFISGGTFNKTNPVTSISFHTSSGFTSDSRVVLYGIK
ncbi:hypothetical protein ABH14_00370 [Brevibacillus brevis]|nr:hypothetical protein [Brevibacillus brevis]